MKQYIAIDLKSFYASVECVERGLDPLTARLVVADESRTEKTICLAVSPALKALGIPGRARLFEVLQKVPKDSIIIAPPQMQKYMAVSQRIFQIYAEFISPDDIHVYSIDEVFIDATSYLKNYKMSARELAQEIIQKVLKATGITATAGIGANLYLAKIAMDIEAKHMRPDQNGVRIAELDEKSYRQKLWNHRPLTDFWRIGPGYSRRLQKYGITTMGQLARFSLTGAEQLYQEFGVNAELLIDHAWGWEPVEMVDIKNYSTDNQSLSSGQVLSRPYSYDEAQTVILEMADQLALDLVRKKLMTDQIILTIGYDTTSARGYTGAIQSDYYGRKVPAHAHGTTGLGQFTNSAATILEHTRQLLARIVNPELKIRRMYIVAGHVRPDSILKPLRQLDIFTDYAKDHEAKAKEKRRQLAILKIKQKYGKNAILKGLNYEKGATARERNQQVGGHRA